MSFRTIRLELGRTPDEPEGNPGYGYEMVVPVDKDGHLDAEAWHENKKDCTVRKFRPNQPDEEGQLIHTRHRSWAISYRPGEDDDEPFFHLETHLLKVGDYVTITEEDGEARPFRVASIR